jgi:two-component system chemotaxis response regulator CheY
VKILVVEDQKTLGMALSWTLSRLGHEARLVNGGAPARELIDREDWRLIITDWMMPDVDGLELCRRIRGREGDPYRYIIMLTGRTERSDRLEGLEAGADDFLTKPVDEDELTIRLAIAKRILAVQWELEASIARLDAIARTDPLTGLSNRRHLDETLGIALSRATCDKPCSVVSLDIDHFKSYNDSFGHAAGDEVLQTVAALLRTGTRSDDLVVRTGGEEFVIVMPGAGPDAALLAAERLRTAIASHSWRERPVTASFGVAAACGPRGGSSRAGVLDAADRALYQSKRSGRNRISLALPFEAMEVASTAHPTGMRCKHQHHFGGRSACRPASDRAECCLKSTGHVPETTIRSHEIDGYVPTGTTTPGTEARSCQVIGSPIPSSDASSRPSLPRASASCC